jgi:membrane fusion protein, macrolide-specific efflux system
MAKNSFSKISINNCLKLYLKKTLIFGTSIGIILSLSGCFLIPKEEEVLAPPLKEPPQVVYDTQEIVKSSFEKKVQVTGYLTSVTQEDLSFKNSTGRLKTIHVKIGDKVEKGKLLAELVTDDLESQIKLQEINLKKVRMIYDMAVASDDTKFNIDRSQLDVEFEKVKLDDLKNKLAQTKLISPISGNVDFITDVKVGSFVDAYSTIVTIADPNDLQVAYGDEKVSEFELGMKVDIVINDVKIPGKVVMTPSNVPLDASEKMKSSIIIKLDKLHAGIAIGDSATITLMQIKKDNVIVINKNIIRTIGAKKFVNVIENGLKKERDIETGEENQTETIIVKGLSEGDQIIKN